MGCRTDLAIVDIAYVLQRLHFFFNFQFFLIICSTYRKKKFTILLQKTITRIDIFLVGVFFIIYAALPQKKLHDLTVFLVGFFYNLSDSPQKKVTGLYRKKRYMTS